MKIHILNGKKIRANISRADLEKRGISYSRLDYTNAQTKRIIAEILNAVKINRDNMQLIIEVYPAFNKGATVYITFTRNVIRTDSLLS